MPTSGLDYDKHGRVARIKPRKELDSRSVTSGSNSRRHRDSSVSSSRSTLPQDLPAQRPESTSSNANLEQLPSLPESESGSPSSASSSMLRTTSNVSNLTSMTSPTIQHRTPASLQPYLESESDLPDILGDSEATPRAEKPKEQCEVKAESPKVKRSRVEPPKPLQPLSDTEVPPSTGKTASESTKTGSIPSSSRAEPPPLVNQETQYRDLHQPAPQHPISSNLAFVPDQSNPAPVYPYDSVPPGQQTFQSPQLTYLPLPQHVDPSTAQQALVSQGMLYYPSYVPPPPAPEPPHQLQYPPGPEHRSRDENPLALLSRVHYAMPDLHALLDVYHNMYAALESRDVQISTMEAQRAAEKQQQDHHFAKLEKDIESLRKKYSSESNRLKLDIGNVEKRCQDLQEKLTAQEKVNDTLEASNESLRADRKQAAKKYEEDKVVMTQKYSLDRDRMVTEQRAKQRVSNDELQAQIRKAEAALSHKEAQISRANEEEKHRLESGWAKQRREMEDRHTKLRMDLEDKLEAKEKVVDEERRTYLQAREGWDREREDLTHRWDEERVLLRKASEEQYKALVTKHEREKNEILRQISQMQQRSDKEDSIFKLQREIESLRSGWEADRFKFQRTTTEFKSTARTLNEQNSKLQRLTEAFGDSIDTKCR